MKPILLAIISAVLFVQISAAQITDKSEPRTSLKAGETSAYKHAQLRFYIETPKAVVVEEDSSGAVLKNPGRPSRQTFVSITRYSGQGTDLDDTVRRQYQRFKNAALGKTIADSSLGLGTFKKLENLQVAGYAAYKVENAYSSETNGSERGVGVFKQSLFFSKKETPYGKSVAVTAM